jgi:hypothetical protein
MNESVIIKTPDRDISIKLQEIVLLESNPLLLVITPIIIFLGCFLIFFQLITTNPERILSIGVGSTLFTTMAMFAIGIMQPSPFFKRYSGWEVYIPGDTGSFRIQKTTP